MGPALIVTDKVLIENGLYLVDGLEPCPAAFDAEMLFEERAVEALDDAAGLCGRLTRGVRWWLISSNCRSNS